MSTLQKHSLRQQAKGALNRVEALEQAFARALVGIERRFRNIQEDKNRVDRILEAVIESIGAEAIQDIVNRRAEEEAQAISSRDKAQLEEAVADGYATPTDKVTPTTLLVGYELDADKKPLGTGRQQIMFKSVEPRFQAELLGKEVGAVIGTNTGGTFEVKEIYEIDEEKARLVLTARAQEQLAAKAAEAAAVAEQDEGESSAEDADGEPLV